MPVIPLGTRYRPSLRTPPFVPGVMTPFEDDRPPEFDPRSMEMEPPPAMNDIRLSPPKPNTPEAMPPVNRMPPPRMDGPLPPLPPVSAPNAHQMAMRAPSLPPPPINVELPPLEGTQAPATSKPPRAPMAEEMAPKPPSNADIQLREAADNLARVQQEKPAAPKSHWSQRLATAILAMTRFAPMTDEIVHPIWSEQERQYNRDLDQAQGQFTAAKDAIEAEGLKEQRDANAEYKKAQIANASLASETADANREQRATEAAARIAQQKSEHNRKVLEDITKGRDSQYQKESEKRPDGWTFIADPDNPGMGFAVAPAWESATEDLLPYLAGVKVGDLVPAAQIKEARKAASQVAVEGARPKTQSAAIQEYERYAADERAAGRQPMSFDAYQDRDANRKAPKTTIVNQEGKLLTPTEAATLGVPYGTTREGAYGKQPATEAQKNTANYASRISQSNKIIDELEASMAPQGLGAQVGQKIAQSGWLPNILTPEQNQMFDQAKRNLINALLRRESGAVISPSEFAEAYQQYIPQPGDTAETLKQKKANRDLVFRNFKASSGNAYEDPPSLGKSSPKVPKVTSEQEYNALPKGAQYEWNGQVLTKQ
jgi:hypothetical protein